MGLLSYAKKSLGGTLIIIGLIAIFIGAMIENFFDQCGSSKAAWLLIGLGLSIAINGLITIVKTTASDAKEKYIA